MSTKILTFILFLAATFCSTELLAETSEPKATESTNSVFIWPLQAGGSAKNSDAFLVTDAIIMHLKNNTETLSILDNHTHNSAPVEIYDDQQCQTNYLQCGMNFAEKFGAKILITGKLSLSGTSWLLILEKYDTETGKLSGNTNHIIFGYIENVLYHLPEIAEEIRTTGKTEDSNSISRLLFSESANNYNLTRYFPPKKPSYKKSIEWIGTNIGLVTLYNMAENNTLNMVKLDITLFSVANNNFYATILELHPMLLIGQFGLSTRLGLRYPLKADYSRELRFGVMLGVDLIHVLVLEFATLATVAPHLQLVINHKNCSFGFGVDFMAAINISGHEKWSHESSTAYVSKALFGGSVFFKIAYNSPF